jgi:hypothetical protein
MNGAERSENPREPCPRGRHNLAGPRRPGMPLDARCQLLTGDLWVIGELSGVLLRQELGAQSHEVFHLATR